MTGGDASKRLSAVKLDDGAALDALTQDIVADAAAPLAALGETWAAAKDEPEQLKVVRVLNLLVELASVAWLRAYSPADQPHKAHAATRAAAGYAQLEARMTKELGDLLASRTPVPQPKPPEPVEERRPPTRECDEAYLLLRRLLRADEPELEQTLSERGFLALTNADRDKTIERFRQKQEWTRFVEDDRP
jgi:hypothetical protein